LWRKEFATFWKVSLLFLVAFLLGTLVLGYSPYTVNLVEHGHPFYPLNEKQLLTTGTLPTNFEGANRFYKLYHSIVSLQGTVSDDTKLKELFTQGIMWPYAQPDVRIGGHGPFFGLILVIMLCSSLFLFNKEQLEFKKLALLVMGTILLSIFVHPEAWWGRYVPQFYLLPFIVGLLLIMSKNSIRNSLGAFLLGFIAFNQVSVFHTYLNYNLKSSAILEIQFATMREHKVVIDLCTFPMLQHRLRDEGIDFTMVDSFDQLPCKDGGAHILYGCFCNPKFCLEEK
jgi:hypothetical protein